MQYPFHQTLQKDAVERHQLIFARFIEIALGSSFELETQFIIVTGLNYISEEQTKAIIEELNILQKRLNALREVILKNQRLTTKD